MDVAALSEAGPYRARNEDRCGAFASADPRARAERGRLFVVADGMGGHAAGDVAATLVLATLPTAYYGGAWPGAAEALHAAFAAANAAIGRAAAGAPGRRGMGATAVAAALVGTWAVVAHVGDARAYLVRGGRARRLTRDHTWVQAQLDAGRLTEEEARVHPSRHAVTRSLGGGANSGPSVGEWLLAPGDALVLCSDGVGDVVPDDEVAGILMTAPDAARAARSLLDWALAAGGDDNLSAIVVRILGPA